MKDARGNFLKEFPSKTFGHWFDLIWKHAVPTPAVPHIPLWGRGEAIGVKCYNEVIAYKAKDMPGKAFKRRFSPRVSEENNRLRISYFCQKPTF